MEHRILGLDLLRAMAILMVLAANSIFIFPVQNPMLAQIGSLCGFFGLEIFFVLSGFLLSALLFPLFMRDDFRFATVVRFIKRRLVRIAPLYFFALFVNVAIAIYMKHPVENVWKYFLFMQNFTTPIPNFFPESWGLPVIVFSSIIFPFTLLLGIDSKVKSKFFVMVILIIIVISICAKWIYNMNAFSSSIAQWEVSLRTVLVYRLDAVFIGALFGWIYRVRLSDWKRLKWPMAFLAFCGIAFLSVGVGYLQLGIGTNSSFWNIWYLPIASISTALLLPIFSAWNPVTLGSAVLFLSNISFAIYVVHFSIILQLTRYLFPIEGLQIVNKMLFALSYIFLTLIASIGIYNTEKTLLKKANPLI